MYGIVHREINMTVVCIYTKTNRNMNFGFIWEIKRAHFGFRWDFFFLFSAKKKLLIYLLIIYLIRIYCFWYSILKLVGPRSWSPFVMMEVHGPKCGPSPLTINLGRNSLIYSSFCTGIAHDRKGRKINKSNRWAKIWRRERKLTRRRFRRQRIEQAITPLSLPSSPILLCCLLEIGSGSKNPSSPVGGASMRRRVGCTLPPRCCT